MKAVVGFISAVLSQVFTGLFLGMLWNYSLVPMGLPTITMTSAVAVWGILVTAVVMLSYIVANIVISVVNYYHHLALTESLLGLVPPDKKKDNDAL